MIFHHANPCKFRGIEGKKTKTTNLNKPDYTLGTKWTHVEQMSSVLTTFMVSVRECVGNVAGCGRCRVQEPQRRAQM